MLRSEFQYLVGLIVMATAKWSLWGKRQFSKMSSTHSRKLWKEAPRPNIGSRPSDWNLSTQLWWPTHVHNEHKADLARSRLGIKIRSEIRHRMKWKFAILDQLLLWVFKCTYGRHWLNEWKPNRFQLIRSPSWSSDYRLSCEWGIAGVVAEVVYDLTVPTNYNVDRPSNIKSVRLVS